MGMTCSIDRGLACRRASQPSSFDWIAGDRRAVLSIVDATYYGSASYLLFFP
jgi:hypothetical protein